MTSTDNTQKLIDLHARRLQKLQEQRARMGVSTPPHVLTEIEDIEAQLATLRGQLTTEQTQLQQTLAGLGGCPRPSPRPSRRDWPRSSGCCKTPPPFSTSAASR